MTHWRDLDGYALSCGITELEELTLGKFCRFVWYWMTRDREHDDVERLREQLWMPPVGEAATVGPWSPEEEAAAFASLKQEFGQ